MTRVIAPSRLHFGLFHVPEKGKPSSDERMFGGVGLMVESPGVVVVAEPADSWQFEGPLASRAQAFAMQFHGGFPESVRRPLRVLVERCPEEHTGLGVGTQLGLAVVRAIAEASGLPHRPSPEFAQRIGRGKRSAVGVYGFDRGGLVVESGKRVDEAISPQVECVPLPAGWRVVLFTPSAPLWQGDRERAAFAAASGGRPERLRQLAETAILPAARTGDLATFGDAVHEFNRLAGEPFAAAQGGSYSSPAIADLIAELRGLGIKGVGQSSWGPTVFAIVDGDSALSLRSRYQDRLPVIVSRVSDGFRMGSR